MFEKQSVIDMRLHEALRCDVRAGFEALERGEFTEYEIDNLEDLTRRTQKCGRRRFAEHEVQTAIS